MLLCERLRRYCELYVIGQYLLQPDSKAALVGFFWKRFYQNCCKKFRLAFAIKCRFNMMVRHHISAWKSAVTWMLLLDARFAVVSQFNGQHDRQIYLVSILSYGDIWKPSSTKFQLTPLKNNTLLENHVMLHAYVECRRVWDCARQSQPTLPILRYCRWPQYWVFILDIAVKRHLVTTL